MVKEKQDKIDNGVWGTAELKELQEDEATKPTQWGLVHTDTFKALSLTRKLLPPGVYTITKDLNDGQAVFFRKEVKNDKTLISKDSLSETIIKEISGFWDSGEVFKKYGFMHSRGYLLYGAQGVGKSSIVQQVMADIVSAGGVVFLCGNPSFFLLGLKTFRQTEPSRPLVCVYEDIDAIIRKYGDDELLSILDGANQIDKVLNIATTNYPESLDRRIISRPRRFDRVYKIEAPDTEVRRAYLSSKLPKKEDLEKWVFRTKGFSFAALAELIISVLCLGNKFEDSIKVLSDMENGHPKSSDFGTALGFGDGKDDLAVSSRTRRSSSPRERLLD